MTRIETIRMTGSMGETRSRAALRDGRRAERRFYRENAGLGARILLAAAGR